MIEALRNVLSSPWFLSVWGASVLLGLAVLAFDLRRHNPQLGSLMKVVWLLTVAYSGLLGLGIYYYSGRKQIADDDTWRRGFRSVAHCYSGCGMGEIAGVLLTVGVLALTQWKVALVTFSFAYILGLALTVGPLVSDGESWKQAFKDAVVAESASIVVMEVVAIGVDLWLAGNAGLTDLLFWASLVVSLTLGLLAAYPVNVLLIHWGVKEGMHDPRHGHGHDNGHGDRQGAMHGHAHA